MKARYLQGPDLLLALIHTALMTSIVCAGTASVQAQTVTVERNPPVRANVAAPTVREDEQASTSADESPLGVNLAGIKLVGLSEQPGNSGTGGIIVGDIGPGRNLRPEFEAVLRPLVGQPLSMALIADAQAAIAGVYRRAGYPFVSVTIPPQEVTNGILTLRVQEFGFGAVSARGVDDPAARRLAAQIRLNDDGRIPAASVNEDLSWLNRSPFRRVEGLFSPGSETGTSDLVLAVTAAKPWQVYAGYSNTGSAETGHSRYFVGAGIALPMLDGAFATYQLTGSSDLFSDLAGLLPNLGNGYDAHRARYVSHAANVVLPLDGRSTLEFSPAHIATRQTSSAFTFDNTIIEVPLYYRTALSNILPGVHGGEVYAGIEYRNLRRQTYFAQIGLGAAEAEILQFGLGWRHEFKDDHGSTGVDLFVMASPGGILAHDNGSAWSAYSNGAVTSASYAYFGGSLSRVTELGIGFKLRNDVVVQLAGQALPDTERLTLGGLDAVRGYGLGDVTADSGIVLRNELRLPQSSPTGSDVLSPFAFVDIGFAQQALASTGIGFDYTIADMLSVNATAALALSDAGSTKAGAVDVKFRLTARY
ncbi:hypothetical protein VW29_14810 [Devosia limi DSM 17137]|uniref:Hemolysin activation/secretion protein n=1 Tax=Devosia limi DSM 17137 TaxID=1121477 RepID=A0A0F5LK83_9HYPH|nr:ShlB/FhaC/HecB family hemolysin secretion/activation protein [Devosia limi]KKB82826.1 hypothetical protein VW29_14810 [Devosia limi DSM 17137]SHF48654.1 Hemolysin activation/secretion protein [Devosia limi DSM 17137]